MFSNKYSPIILISLLLLGLLSIVYLNFLLPRYEEVNSLQNAISNIQHEVNESQQNINSIQGELQDSAKNLIIEDKRLPWQRDLVELLRNMEEIQLVSDLSVKTISFNYDDMLANESLSVDTSQLHSTSTEEKSILEEYSLTEDGSVTTENWNIEEVGLSLENIRLISFTIEVESASEEHLLTYMKEMESLERIIKVKSISYSLAGEQGQLSEAESGQIIATIQATAFYFIN